ncbi:MAG: hypothetical protein KBD78_09070 [Oligoflexales bacterium]|nr:hypothetical protein [Oligoflexales bacterium]
MKQTKQTQSFANSLFLMAALIIVNLSSSLSYASSSTGTTLLKQLEQKCSPAESFLPNIWTITLDKNNKKILSNLPNVLSILSIPGFGLDTKTSLDPSQDTVLYFYFEIEKFKDMNTALEVRNQALEQLLLLSGIDAVNCVPVEAQSSNFAEMYPPAASSSIQNPDEIGDGGVTGSNGSCEVVENIDPIIIIDGDKLPGNVKPIDWISKY